MGIEEQSKILKAGRSNNELDTTKLMADMPEGVVINDIKTACELCFQRMQKNLTDMGWLPNNMPAESVDDFGALLLSICNELHQIARLARLWKRCQLDIFLPRQPKLHGVHCCGKLARELIGNTFVH